MLWNELEAGRRYEINLGAYNLVVLRNHAKYPGKWVMHLYPPVAELAVLGLSVQDVEDIKGVALRTAAEQLMGFVRLDTDAAERAMRYYNQHKNRGTAAKAP